MLAARGWSRNTSRGVRKINTRITATITSYCHVALGKSQKMNRPSAFITSSLAIRMPLGCPADQGQKFVPRGFVLTERAEHVAGHRSRMLLFDSPHHHAEMLRFHQNPYSSGRNRALHRFANLLRHPLLQLQSPREH